MTDIAPEYEGVEDDDEAEEEEEDEIFYEIYVETASNLIHEVQFFDNFCLVRPASPNLYLAIRKLNLTDFAKEFHEYLGDAAAVRSYLRNSNPEVIVE